MYIQKVSLKSFLFFKLLIIVVSFGFIACAKDQGKLKKVCVEIDSVKYSQHVSVIIQNNCLQSGCHNAGSINGDISTYNLVQAKVNDGTFENRVFNSKDMPPAYSSGPTKLDECDLKVLRQWIDQGMLP
jgi:hypothetical protein